MLIGTMNCITPAGFCLDALCVWVDEERHAGPMHMAIDEILLSVDAPTLRTYRWPEPWVSIGTTVSAGEATKFASGRPWVRRWTGGGMVEHGRDLTIALAIPAMAYNAKIPPRSLYEAVHSAALAALADARPDLRMAVAADFAEGVRCFESPVCGDVMHQDTKILGGALRRTRSGVLYQGSLQVSAVPDDFARRMAAGIASDIIAWQPEDDFYNAARLVAEQYRSDDWANKRP